MNVQDIPPQTLNEVYNTIAQRLEVDLPKLTKDSIDEAEFMAALAYNQGSPLIDENDLTESLVTLCKQSARELDPKGMAEYKFVPLTIRGQTLLVISSCPWDPMMVEVISGYFPQCTQVRFALTSPQTLASLLALIQGEALPSPAVAGYIAKPVAPQPRAVLPSARPTSTAQPPAQAPRPSNITTGPTPQKQEVQSIQTSRPPTTTTVDIGQLSPEEATYLINLVVQEGNKILVRKRSTKL